MQKKYLIYGLIMAAVVTGVLFYTTSESQSQAAIAEAPQNVIQYNSPTNFSVVLPPGYPSARDGGNENVQKGTGDTCSIVVLEYGDGTFTTQFQSAHHYNQMPQGNMFLAITRYYDTTDLPDMFARTKNGVAQSNTPNIETSLLDRKESFNLVPHVNTVIPNEANHFIIPFKNTRSLFVCFYNNLYSRFFSKIQTPESAMRINGLDIPYIRVHNGQQVFTDVENVPVDLITGIPNARTAMRNFISSQMNSGLQFADYFIVYNDPDLKDSTINRSSFEKNMFFSLPPTADYTAEELDSIITTIRLFKFEIANQMLTNSFVDKQLRFIAGPHDPNDISIYPDCISRPDTKHDVTVNFQNLGLGDVEDKIIIRVTIPKPMISSFSSLNEAVIGTNGPLADNKISMVKKVAAGTAPDTLTITLKTTLEGLMGKPLGALDESTKGDIQFTVVPGAAASLVPLKFEADIIFDTQPPIHTYYIINNCVRKPLCKPCSERSPENDKPPRKPKSKPFGC